LGIICNLLLVYLLILVGRAILSWFPVRPGTAMASINSILYDLTEPLLAPLRRVVPSAGMIDLSFLVLFFGIVILRQVLCGVGGGL
jgi:YggT family protein